MSFINLTCLLFPRYRKMNVREQVGIHFTLTYAMAVSRVVWQPWRWTATNEYYLAKYYTKLQAATDASSAFRD